MLQWKCLEINFLQKQGELYGGIAQKVGVPKTNVYDKGLLRAHGTPTLP